MIHCGVCLNMVAPVDRTDDVLEWPTRYNMGLDQKPVMR